jgi:hypothetical protein
MSRAIPVLIPQTAPPPIIYFNMFQGANIGQLKQQIINYLKNRGFKWKASECVMTVRFKNGGIMTVFDHDILENWTQQHDFLAFQVFHHFRGGIRKRRKTRRKSKKKRTRKSKKKITKKSKKGGTRRRN